MPAGFEAGQTAAGRVRDLVNEQRRAKQAEAGRRGVRAIGRCSERLLQAQPEGDPAHTSGQQQVAPIDGGARSDAYGEPFAQQPGDLLVRAVVQEVFQAERGFSASRARRFCVLEEGSHSNGP